MFFSVSKDGVAAAFIAASTCSTVTSPSTTEVKIVVDPVGTGTRWAEPINFPFNSELTNPIVFAAPVELGTILTAAARALLKSHFLWENYHKLNYVDFIIIILLLFHDIIHEIHVLIYIKNEHYFVD